MQIYLICQQSKILWNGIQHYGIYFCLSKIFENKFSIENKFPKVENKFLEVENNFSHVENKF